ncbi:hypothetical protein MTP99_012286 [Tenebrio molitor]|jgi:hypothetical protein|nr:hypothetical protein MTP99_012286 [Tenebrio molitor]
MQLRRPESTQNDFQKDTILGHVTTSVLGNVYVGAVRSDTSDDKSEVPTMVFKWQFAFIAALIAHPSSNINVPLIEYSGEIDRTGLKILENKNIQSIISVNTNILLRLGPTDIVNAFIHNSISE